MILAHHQRLLESVTRVYAVGEHACDLLVV
jgi:hypothetical protein